MGASTVQNTGTIISYMNTLTVILKCTKANLPGLLWTVKSYGKRIDKTRLRRVTIVPRFEKYRKNSF